MIFIVKSSRYGAFAFTVSWRDFARGTRGTFLELELPTGKYQLENTLGFTAKALVSNWTKTRGRGRGWVGVYFFSFLRSQKFAA